MRETKTVPMQIKAAGPADGLQAGQFIAVVSVFGNIDYGYDRVMPGAFDDTIKAWQDSGDPLPVIWSHKWQDPFAHIGYTDPQDIKATDVGLEILGNLDMDEPLPAKVNRLLVGRRVKEFSFGYFPDEYVFTEDPETHMTIRDLTKITVFETGPTLLGMNPDTQLIAAASLLHSAPDPIGAKWLGQLQTKYGDPTAPLLSSLGDATDPPVPPAEGEGKSPDDEPGDTEGKISTSDILRVLAKTRFEETTDA